jgi:chorismate mutase
MRHETESTVKSLEEWRREIDKLDSELLLLLNQRAGIACELGAIKVASGLPAYDGRRERQVLARLCRENQGPFAEESVSRIFRRIILETRRIGKWSMRQQRVKWESEKTGKEHGNGHQYGAGRL